MCPSACGHGLPVKVASLYSLESRYVCPVAGRTCVAAKCTLRGSARFAKVDGRKEEKFSIYKTKVCKGKILCVGVFLFNTAYFQCLCLSEFPPFPKNLMLCIALDTLFRLFIVYIYKGHTRNWQCKEYVVVPVRSQCLRKLSVLVI